MDQLRPFGGLLGGVLALGVTLWAETGPAQADGFRPVGVRVQQEAPADPSSPATSTPCPSPDITVTGWLTTVWGAGLRYWVTDDRGQAVEVLLPEEVTRPFGGPQALDRRRVTIVGEVVRHDPLQIRALSLAPVIS
jgi:hypothetical protein